MTAETTVPDPLESPADTLRRAAKQMREYAAAATPGPWQAVAGIWRDETGHGAASQEADALHAASWHPLVAAAVADWLETEAHMAALRGNSAEGQTFHALKVARAYLGEPS